MSLRISYCVTISLIYHLSITHIICTEAARPLIDSKSVDNGYMMRIANIQEMLNHDFMYISAIKIGRTTSDQSRGGPSSGGRGHASVNAAAEITHEEMKNSGPSGGGKGHAFVNAQITDQEMKYSGPSGGGKGHAFVNAQVTEEMKNSGHESHDHEISNAEKVKEMKIYGHGYFQTLGEENNSGPSLRGKGH